MRRRLAATIVWAALLAGLASGALAQSGSLQVLLDDAPAGSTLRLPPDALTGPARLERPLTMLGVDGSTTLSGGGGAGPVLTFGPVEAALRFVTVADAAVGLVVAEGARVSIGPARFERVETAVRVEGGGLAFIRNDPTIPTRLDVSPGGRLFFSTVGMIEASDESTGAQVPGILVELIDADGARLTSTANPMGGPVEFDVPTLERGEGGDAPVDEGMWLRVRAPGYEDARVPLDRFGSGGAPVRLEMRSNAAPLEASSVRVPDAPRLSAGEAVAVAATSAAVALGAAAALAFRSERRWWRALGLLVAPLYTRLRRDELLDNPTRQRILAHVEAHPGVRYRELQRALSLRNGALAHHLQVLRAAQLLCDVEEGQAVRFYLPGARPSDPSDTAERVFAFVCERPGATGRELAAALGISGALVSYHLRRLDEGGRIRRVRDGGRVRAYPAP